MTTKSPMIMVVGAEGSVNEQRLRALSPAQKLKLRLAAQDLLYKLYLETAAGQEEILEEAAQRILAYPLDFKRLMEGDSLFEEDFADYLRTVQCMEESMIKPIMQILKARFQDKMAREALQTAAAAETAKLVENGTVAN